VRAFVDKALDTAINWIVGKAKALFKGIVQAGVPQDPNERLRQGLNAAAGGVNRFAGRRVTALILQPFLSAVQIRYGMSRLEVVPKGKLWAVRGTVNPEGELQTTAQVGASGEPGTSAEIVERAKTSLRAHADTDYTLEAAGQIVNGIEAELKPFGLKSLSISSPSEEGGRTISASINPVLPLAALIKAAKQSPAFPSGATKRTVLSAVQIRTTQPALIAPGPISPTVPVPGQLGAGVQYGGVVLPSLNPNTIQVVTWNLSLDYGLSRQRAAQSDAEMQFINWYDQQTDAFKQSIESLLVNNQPKSPCFDCAAALTKLGRELHEVHHAPLVSKPRLVWTTLHTGISGTTSESLYRLNAYWDLEAPTSAIPEPPGTDPRSVFANMVRIKLL
jgi:hypothetical protein